MLFCVPTVRAQSIDAVRFETVDWIFVPAVAQNDDILGFLSWTDIGVVGQNITLIWYEYDANTGVFTTLAWKHSDVGAAALWLRQNYSEGNMFAFNEELPGLIATADVTNIIAPKPFTNGLFDDDPLSPVLNGSEDPQPIIDALASIGYSAAPSVSGMSVATGSSGSVQIGQNPVPIDVACVIAAGSLEAMMLNDLYNRAKSLLDFGVDLPDNRSCGWPCTCTATTALTPTGPWTPPATFDLPFGAQECRWSRPSNKTTTWTGKTWARCRNCFRTVGPTAGFEMAQDGPLLPDETCPAIPPGTSTTWWGPVIPIGYP